MSWTQEEYLDSRIFMMSEDDSGDGYICSVCEKSGNVFAQFWAEGCESSRVAFHSKESMLERSKEFVDSLLINYSPLHIAKHKMMLAYIKWYENQNENVSNEDTKKE